MYKLQYTKEELEFFVKNSECCRDMILLMGKSPYGSTHSYWKKAIEKFGIDSSHWKTARRVDKEKLGIVNDIPVRVNAKKLRKIILDSGIEYKCNKCFLSEWQNKPITLHVDHIDSNWNNNNITNLRFLCPNCHSQEPTSKSGYKQSLPKIKKRCVCGKEIYLRSTHCQKCTPRDKHRKVKWPSKEELIKLLLEKPLTRIGEQFGVSDNAVRGWRKYYGI